MELLREAKRREQKATRGKKKSDGPQEGEKETDKEKETETDFDVEGTTFVADDGIPITLVLTHLLLLFWLFACI